MKNYFLPFLILLGLTLNLTGCGKTDTAQKSSDKFFKLIINKNYEAALIMIEDPSEKVEIMEALKSIGDDAKNGKLLSFEKTFGFNTNISNGITTVKLPYTLKYKYAERKCEVVLKDRGKGFKITSVL